jgi:hypothetical protein
MAMQQPSTRIIEHKPNNQISRRGQHSHVATGRIREIEIALVGEIAVGFLAEYVEVVAVEMDGVRNGSGVDDDPEGPLSLFCQKEGGRKNEGGREGEMNLRSWLHPRVR